MNKTLVNEPSMLFSPTLASLIGLNKSVFLQYLNYWQYIKSLDPEFYSKDFYDGDYWLYMTVSQFCDQLPFFSKLGSKNPEKTMQRLIDGLIEDGLIESMKFNAFHGDQTCWYRVKIKEIENLISINEEKSKEINRKRLGRKARSLQDQVDLSVNNLSGSEKTCLSVGQNIQVSDKMSKSKEHIIPYESSYDSHIEDSPANAGICLDGKDISKQKKSKSALEEKKSSWVQLLWNTMPKDRLPNSKKMVSAKLNNLEDQDSKKIKCDEEVIEKIKKAIEIYDEHHWSKMPEEERKFIPLLNNFIGKNYWLPSLEDIERRAKQLGSKNRPSNARQTFDSNLKSFADRLKAEEKQYLAEIEQQKMIGDGL